jgi:hypothetical protein
VTSVSIPPQDVTPVGDYLHARFGGRAGATHWMGEGTEPGCCGGPHSLCTYMAGWREALRVVALFARDADPGAEVPPGMLQKDRKVSPVTALPIVPPRRLAS